jgi:hypothetical protein
MHNHIKQKLENDLPKDLRSDLSVLSLFSDEELWDTARSKMNDDEQSELESLAELKKQRQLSDSEQSNLNRLIHQAECVILCKAEAYRLLARRGYKVF